MRIAVIGAGIAGLGSAWALARRHEVELFEADRRPGGHADTIEVEGQPVDMGFIVYNTRTYPNLIRLFDHLDVATEASDMSFGVSLARGQRRLDYGSDGLGGLFADARNLLSPGFHRMWIDILRFYRRAPALAADPARAAQPLGAFLAEGGWSRAFAEDHLLPMAAAIWSAPEAEILDFPLGSFLAFCRNHGLVQLTGRPQWRTVTGGSRAYVAQLAAALGPRLVTGTAATRVRRTLGGVVVETGAGPPRHFDQVVLATHSDQSLALLADPTEEERGLLGAVRWSANRAILHSDPALMPAARRAWSSWNYLGAAPDASGRGGIAVTYWMNRLQNLPAHRPLFVTLNPLTEPARHLTWRETVYHHPILDGAAIAAQRRLPELQGLRHTWHCGAWTGWGFHEDGLASGLAVARALDAAPPWQVEEMSPAAAHARPSHRPAAVMLAAAGA